MLDSGEMLFFAPGGCSRRVCDPPIAGRRYSQAEKLRKS